MPNWTGDDGVSDFPSDSHLKNIRMSRDMAKKRINPKKPTLVIVGESFINPDDVACIKKVRTKTDLYVITLKSQPNAEFPMWANGEEVATLIKHFNVVE